MIFDARGSALTTGTVALGVQTLTSDNGIHGGVVTYHQSAAVSAGTFTFRNVPQGNYNLLVAVPARGTFEAEAASVPIIVADGDVTDVVVKSSTGAKVRGRVETDNGTLPPFNPSRLRVVTIGNIGLNRFAVAGRPTLPIVR